MNNLLLVCSDETFEAIVTDCIHHYCNMQQTEFDEAWAMMFGEDSTFIDVLNDRIEAIDCMAGLLDSLD
jgi:hypothetical protein